MSDIKTVASCPLGSKCEEIKDGAIHRCSWYVTMVGKNPQTDEDVNTKDCAIAWMPILLIENSKQQRSTAVAVESMRNETVKSADNLVGTLLTMANARPQIIKYEDGT